MRFDKNYQINYGLGFAALLIVFFLYHKHYKRKHSNDYLLWSVKGPVEKITYENRIPFITIKGQEYNGKVIGWDRKIKIYVGDTLLKKTGDSIIVLIRKNSRDSIFSKYGHQIYPPEKK